MALSTSSPSSRSARVTVRTVALSVGAVLASGLLAAVPASASDPSSTTPAPLVDRAADRAPADRAPADRGPALRVRTVVGGLERPWDLDVLPNGGLIYTQRDRETVIVRGPAGKQRRVLSSPPGMWHSGETGLMAVELHPRYERNRLVYLCSGWQAGGRTDVRVTMWRMGQRLRLVKPVVAGLPATSGRHGGCQLRFGRTGALYVGTGDAAVGTNPRDLRSGGGKVLRVDARTGRGHPGNPFPRADSPMKRRVLTYGHRNVQGLALRPGGGMWSVEHGSTRDDEVNALVAGGDYGWNPVPGYDESVPMTDQSLPGRQIEARWRSGEPTIAPSGAAWLRGKQWGRWNGALAMSVLGDQHLRILRFSPRGRLVGQARPPALDGDVGRLRGAEVGPGGALYLTTDNSGDGVSDRILRVVPRR